MRHEFLSFDVGRLPAGRCPVMALAVLVSVLVVLANLAVAGLLVLRWDRRFEPPNAPGTRQPAEVRPGR